MICRVLAFLDTAYHDNVLTAKERYERPSVDLVAVDGDNVIGLCDVECETDPATVCSPRHGLGGMIWHLAVHPNHRGRGIGATLLREAERHAAEHGVQRLEAWTRDDAWVQRWYEARGFRRVDSYLHVYIDGPEANGVIESRVPGLMPAQTFAHYVGPDREQIRSRFRRVHECVLYERRLAERL